MPVLSINGSSRTVVVNGELQVSGVNGGGMYGIIQGRICRLSGYDAETGGYNHTEDVTEDKWQILSMTHNGHVWRPLYVEDAINLLRNRPATLVRELQLSAQQPGGQLALYRRGQILEDTDCELVVAAQLYIRQNYSLSGDQYGVVKRFLPWLNGHLFHDRVFFFQRTDYELSCFNEQNLIIDVEVPKGAYRAVTNESVIPPDYIWAGSYCDTHDCILKLKDGNLHSLEAEWQTI